MFQTNLKIKITLKTIINRENKYRYFNLFKRPLCFTLQVMTIDIDNITQCLTIIKNWTFF